VRFEQALLAMRDGERFRCGEGDAYWEIRNGIMYHMSTSGFSAGYSVPSHSEMMSESWEPMLAKP
jgi:hypothetical protein